MLKKTVLLVLIVFVAGCANMRSDADNDFIYDPPEPVPQAEAATHKFYDFEDIPIPTEMKINTRESILFETQNIRSGILNFSGRVDSDSLFNYLQVAMTNEGWRLLNSIKYGTYMLAFDKPDRFCIIRIVPRQFSSELQIWISPKIDRGQ